VVSRLRLFYVAFMTPPVEVKLESSQDLEYWETLLDYRGPPGWWNYWWWGYWNWFDPMKYCRGIKIIMHGLKRGWYGRRHGIWYIAAYTQ